jgi:N6-adenosine-specific RNA methylase IME4
MNERLAPPANDIITSDRVAEANQAYGALTEGLYITAFTFERVMTNVLALLTSGGWRLTGPGFDDVNGFIRSLRLDRFKAVAEQRKEFVQRVKELQPEISNRAIASAFGVSHDTVNRDAGRNRPPNVGDAQENREAGGRHRPGADGGRRDARIIANRDVREERREAKLKSIGEAAALKGLFPVLYADPPWKDVFGHSGRDTDIHYPTMTLEEIKAVPVKEISMADAVLYLWALPHMMPEAFEVMAAWGFKCRTDMIWMKDKIGIGEWVRNQHETLFIGRKGAFPPPPTAVRSPSVVRAPRLKEHSAKPEVFLELIERWYPNMPKIELFRRGASRPGWAAWGNEVKAEAAE